MKNKAFIRARGSLLRCPRCYASAGGTESWVVHHVQTHSVEARDNAGKPADELVVECDSCGRRFTKALDDTVDLTNGPPVLRCGIEHAHLVYHFDPPPQETKP